MLFRSKRVHAYDYNMTGAYEGGEVVITPLRGNTTHNGFAALAGYQVQYQITNEWLAFSQLDGGYFYTGNSIDASGGCHFAYHTSGGAIWEQGALVLGAIEGEQQARVDAVQDTVSYSFTVKEIEQLPNYIAYVYDPAGSIYLHITEERGKNAHVWFYKNLKDASIKTATDRKSVV